MAGSGEQTPDSVVRDLTEGSAGQVAAARQSSSGKTSASVGSADQPAKKASGKKSAAKKSTAKKAPAKKSAAKKAPAKQSAAKKSPAVRADEQPWTDEELAEVRELLQMEAARLREEISEAENGIAEMLRDSSDAGGEDQADTGSKTFEREHEMSLAASHREILGQTERALSRLEDGSYGICENCGNPIGKARLLAFPRATLCMTCKEREERR